MTLCALIASAPHVGAEPSVAGPTSTPRIPCFTAVLRLDAACTGPDDDLVAAITALPGVTGVEVDGERAEVRVDIVGRTHVEPVLAKPAALGCPAIGAYVVDRTW